MANVETRRDENNTFLRSGCTTNQHHDQHANTLSSIYRGAARQFVYFIEIWARGGSRRQPVEATEREKRSKEGLEDFCGARRPAQYGLGEGSGAGRRPACTVSASCGCSSASTENFPIKGPEGQRAPSDHQCRSHGTRRAALGCAVKHTDHSRQCRAFVAPRRPATVQRPAAKTDPTGSTTTPPRGGQPPARALPAAASHLTRNRARHLTAAHATQHARPNLEGVVPHRTRPSRSPIAGQRR